MGYTMSQTKEGAIKAVQTIEKKYGKDYWKKIGSKGGANGTGHAFGHGKRVDLQADHIKPFAMYPELRFDVDNGRTMCIPCHKLTDTYGGKTLKLIKEGASNGNV